VAFARCATGGAFRQALADDDKAVLEAVAKCLTEGALKGRSVGWFAPEYKFISEAYNEIADILAPACSQPLQLRARLEVLLQVVHALGRDDEPRLIAAHDQLLRDEVPGRQRLPRRLAGDALEIQVEDARVVRFELPLRVERLEHRQPHELFHLEAALHLEFPASTSRRRSCRISWWCRSYRALLGIAQDGVSSEMALNCTVSPVS
jgi:hypothetical protein